MIGSSKQLAIRDRSYARLDQRDLLQDSKAFCLGLLIPLDDILGSSRKQPIVTARHAYWTWLSEHHALSAAAIGRLLERDHTAVLYGIDQTLNRRPRLCGKEPRKPSERMSEVVADVRMVGWDRASLEELVAGGGGG